MQMTLLSFSKIGNELNNFSNFSGLKPNKTKCELADIGALNGVKVALLRTYCQKRKHFKIMAHEIVNFRRKNYDLQILSCF